MTAVLELVGREQDVRDALVVRHEAEPAAKSDLGSSRALQVKDRSLRRPKVEARKADDERSVTRVPLRRRQIDPHACFREKERDDDQEKPTCSATSTRMAQDHEPPHED